MLQKIRRSSTPFFDTYRIYDPEKRQFVGLLEDHCRGVKSRYFIGWAFPAAHYIPDTRQPAQTQMFDDEAAALAYIAKGA